MSRIMSSKLSQSFYSTNGTIPVINYYYDVVSPWSWYSFEVLMRYKKHWNAEIVLKPTLLNAVFQMTTNTSPMFTTCGAKAKYGLNNLIRAGKYYGVPLKPLKDFSDLFEQGSLAPMRLLVAIEHFSPENLEAASRAFWMIRWNKDENMTTTEALQEVITKSGLTEKEQNQVMQMMKGEVKQILKDRTQETVEKNIFGVPTMQIDEYDGPRIFFGGDSLPMLAFHLDLPWNGPFPNQA